MRYVGGTSPFLLTSLSRVTHAEVRIRIHRGVFPIACCEQVVVRQTHIRHARLRLRHREPLLAESVDV